MTILLITQDSSLSSIIQEVLSRIQGLRLETVKNHEEASERVLEKKVALVLSHLNPSSDLAGLTRLLGTVEATGQKIPTMVLSEEYHAEQAVTLLRRGVADYLSRPLDLGRLGYLIDVLTLSSRRRPVRPEPAQRAVQPQVPKIEGNEVFPAMPAGRMGKLIEQIRRIAPQDTTILLGGETGTGKTRLAGVIHRLSARRDKPFMTINCGSLAANLIESEMFGHVKGAFTSADVNRVGKFTEVGNGTLFLDEIDSLPSSLQAKLLQAVEERVFEPVGSNKTQKLQARLIVASNKPLDEEVAAGRFRPDLYYRLNVVAFNLPPLREWAGGISPLAQGFLAEFGSRAGRTELSISADAMRALEAHPWPGNIRELRNVIERAVALSDGPMIGVEDLPDTLIGHGPTPSLKLAPLSSDSTLAQSKDVAERERIEQAMERNGNNRLRAAAELGISRMTLYNKLRRFGFIGHRPGYGHIQATEELPSPYLERKKQILITGTSLVELGRAT
jgi:DNA-binding NtrC family response regulator